MKHSRQYRWQQKQKEAGLCVRCGSKRGASLSYCDDCLLWQRKYQRKAQGYRRWKAGRRGRPPLTKG